MKKIEIDEKTSERIKKVLPILNESQKRKYLAAEAEAIGKGGISAISRLAKVDRNTIAVGMKEINSEEKCEKAEVEKAGVNRIRKEGGGRKKIEESQPGITDALLKIVDSSTYGNPENPLTWTSKSSRHIREELCRQGYKVSHVTVTRLLEDNGFSLQQNQKMKQVGMPSPDRDAQFKHINDTAQKYINENQPVVSVDCKKKENIGNFKNDGAEYSKSKCPVKVLDHDFPLPELGKAVPYGIYDINRNEGYVNVGISSDTAEFAVHSLFMWWSEMGKKRYPEATKLYITADGGGSNGSRNRLWKKELQKFADKTGLTLEISHFPPGTSKWNKIEHRMFSQISKNWRGKPLETIEVIISLISNTATKNGLKIKCDLDSSIYKTGISVSDEEMDKINIVYSDLCPNWNYIISPHT